MIIMTIRKRPKNDHHGYKLPNWRKKTAAMMIMTKFPETLPCARVRALLIKGKRLYLYFSVIEFYGK